MPNNTIAALVYFLFLISPPIKAQDFSIFFVQKADSSFDVFAKNAAFCPYQFTLNLHNAESFNYEISLPFYGIIPEQTQKLLLFGLKSKNGEKPKLFYSQSIGNPSACLPDTNHIYLLPYSQNSKHKVIQGYNGRFSHQNQFALDFKMKRGTQVCASREGMVILVKADSDKRGNKPKFSPFANRVLIYHADGTFAEYFHLQKNGVLVKVGDTIRAGQPIAYSGNSGWSTRPHLHFTVKKPVEMGTATIPTLFWNDKKEKIFLKQGKVYTAFYP